MGRSNFRGQIWTNHLNKNQLDLLMHFATIYSTEADCQSVLNFEFNQPTLHTTTSHITLKVIILGMMWKTEMVPLHYTQ